jgi:acetyl esterase/lipase
VKALLVLVFTLALSGCADLLNFTIPRDGYTVARNVSYGSDPRQQVDIYMPDQPAAGSPVIVFIYGGRWEMGSKDDYLFAGQALASKGFTTVIADYRIYPQVHFPIFIEDSAAALVWAHNHIAEYKGNPNNLFVMGHSSGAYNAVMVATNESYLKKAGGSTSWLRGAIGISGPYDFYPFDDKDIIEIFSAAPGPQTQPITFVHKDMPPMLLATGDADTTVKPKNTYNFAKKSEAMQNSVEVKTYSGVKHMGIILSLARGFRDKTALLDDITDFITQHTSGK